MTKGGLHPGRAGAGFGLGCALEGSAGDAAGAGGCTAETWGATVAIVGTVAGGNAVDVGGIGGVGAEVTGNAVHAGWAAPLEGGAATALPAAPTPPSLPP